MTSVPSVKFPNLSSFHDYSCDERIGITLVAQSATISCLSVVSLLCYVAFKSFSGEGRKRLFRSHLDLYFLGLMMSDLVQAIGGMMDIRWIRLSGVFEGGFCTAQSILKQFGDVGVAFCTLAIAAHTFSELIFRWREPKSFKIPIIVLSLITTVLALFVGVGYAAHRGSTIPYFGQTTYWCWIREEYVDSGIGLEYTWLWVSACMNVLFYIPVFLVLRGVVIVELADNRFGRRIIFTTKEQRQELRKTSLGRIKAHRMLLYPAVYILTVAPISIARIHRFLAGGNSVPLPATIFCAMLFSASGFFNVLVYTLTRPALFRPAPQVHISRHDKVFFYGGGDSQAQGSLSRLPSVDGSNRDIQLESIGDARSSEGGGRW